MDPASQRAAKEEVESYAPPMAEAGSRGKPAPLVQQEVPAQLQQALF